MSYADRKLFTGRSSLTEHGLFNDDGRFDGVNAALCKAIGEALSRFYPGHPWAVSAEVEHGIVKFSLAGFQQWAHVIHVATLKSDPGLSTVKKAAGEMLERFNMPRKGFSSADWFLANQRMPMHFNRNAAPPT